MMYRSYRSSVKYRSGLRYYITDCEKGLTELRMVHVIFRHGERTTEIFYPNDPHKNSKFYPFGIGGLTNKGKAQMYQLGKFLRTRYDKFLGPIYTDDIMEVHSTGFGRTRKSALLVLSGLWPPTGEQIWNKDLSWLPIEVDYKLHPDDNLLNVDLCPRRQQILETLYEEPEVKRIYIDPYKDVYDFVREKSGMTINSPKDLAKLYTILKTEEEASDLVLPDWTKDIYPEPMHEACSVAYSYLNYHPEARTINTGFFMDKVLNDCKSKMYNEDEKKIVLYSAHETTVGVFLDALKVPPHIPKYGSAAIIELHKGPDQSWFLKILYKRETYEDEIEDVVLPGCESLCPLYDFEKKLEDVLPKVSFEEAGRRKL